MKNPNGYGTVVKLSGNRRNPYAVRKTIGYNDSGYPIYKAIGYAPTREQGLIMLAEYNRNPYDIDMQKITVKEVYDRWSDRAVTKMNKNTFNALKVAWKHCKSVETLKYKDLKAYQMQECIDNCGRGYSSMQSIKSLFWHLDKFALEMDIILKCNSSLITAPSIPDTKKKPFTDEEILAIWQHQDIEWVDSVLVLLYSAWRISEFLDMKKSDIDLNNMTMTGGTKTDSGKNRIVPIHNKILPFILNRMETDGEYLFSYNGSRCANTTYYTIWNKIMEMCNMHHTPHECRHTFRSRLDSAGANDVCMNLLMGHRPKDVGKRVYTHKTIEELRQTILLLD